jgi:hypothetical protein
MTRAGQASGRTPPAMTRAIRARRLRSQRLRDGGLCGEVQHQSVQESGCEASRSRSAPPTRWSYCPSRRRDAAGFPECPECPRMSRVSSARPTAKRIGLRAHILHPPPPAWHPARQLGGNRDGLDCARTFCTPLPPRGTQLGSAEATEMDWIARAHFAPPPPAWHAARQDAGSCHVEKEPCMSQFATVCQ